MLNYQRVWVCHPTYIAIVHLDMVYPIVMIIYSRFTC